MRAAIVALMALASCHLASTPEPSCPAGTHVQLGVCVLDAVPAPAIAAAIADGGACAVTPATYTVTSGQVFHFTNQTDVDRDVVGADGQAWAHVPKNADGPDEKIDKVGSWAYTIAGCQGGTVVVQ